MEGRRKLWDSKRLAKCLQVEARNSRLGELLLCVFNSIYRTDIYHVSCLKRMTLPISNFFAFLDFSRNRLATHELLPGDT